MTPTDPDPAAAPGELDLLGLAPNRLEEMLAPAGFSRRLVKNLFRRLHESPGVSLADLRGARRAVRDAAARRFRLVGLEPDGSALQPEDRHTRKLLFKTSDGLPVETVLMPRRRGEGWTVCVSSQVGCRVGCTFCRTGEMGLYRNLTAGEIVDQVRWARAGSDEPIRNIVFMGMGEPLENVEAVAAALEVLRAPESYAIGAHRITVSTSGHVPGMRLLGRLARRVNLAVSLNAPDDELRDRIMPINRRYPLKSLLKAMDEYPLPSAGTILVEYVLLAGVNDEPRHARELRALLEDRPIKLNLIPYNPVPGLPYRRPTDDALRRFREGVGSVGRGVMVRYSFGGGIEAACGQLGAEVLARPGAAPALEPQPPLAWSRVEV